jgi:hypothetical protein
MVQYDALIQPFSPFFRQPFSFSAFLMERVCKNISFFHCGAKDYHCFWLQVCYIKGIG